MLAVVAAATLSIAALVVTPAVTQAGASPAASTPPKPVATGSAYLALGDSVSFGYREPTNTPTPDYTDASSFVGFPEDVASNLGLNVSNPSCPGETSGSLLSLKKLSYACDRTLNGDNGYRTHLPLHVKYTDSQMQYGIGYLKAHQHAYHHVRLVTLMIGANDGFLCQARTKDMCESEFPALLSTISKNVTKILNGVRNTGGYTGQIVIVNYYSIDYTSSTDNEQSEGVNQAVDAAAKPFDVTVADGYTAFQNAAAQAGGDTCAAGLLTTLSGGGCGVHPSVAGQALLAQTVEQAIQR